MRRDLLSVLKGAAVLEISGNSGGAKSVAAGGVGQGCSLGSPLDYVKNVATFHRIPGQLFAFFEPPEKQSLLLIGDSGRRDPGVKIFVKEYKMGETGRAELLF
jgi:hypothetical protein